MDISKDLEARSDQLNAIDLAAGPVTVTILEVHRGGDQRVSLVTDVFGPGRPFKPSKTVLRILANAWKTPETADWVHRQMTLYRDPSVRWANEEVGGIRVSALSHIDQPFKINLQASKSKYALYAIQPIAAAPPARDWLAELEHAGTDVGKLRDLGNAALRAKADPSVVAAIRAAVDQAQKGSTDAVDA